MPATIHSWCVGIWPKGISAIGTDTQRQETKESAIPRCCPRLHAKLAHSLTALMIHMCASKVLVGSRWIEDIVPTCPKQAPITCTSSHCMHALWYTSNNALTTEDWIRRLGTDATFTSVIRINYMDDKPLSVYNSKPTTSSGGMQSCLTWWNPSFSWCIMMYFPVTV